MKGLRSSFKMIVIYIVIDNSTDNICSDRLAKYAERKSFVYIKSPDNRYKRKVGSVSHAIAINWLFKFIKNNYSPEYTILLDHYIFLLGKVSMLSLFQNYSIYCRMQNRGTVQYIWPGFFAIHNGVLRKYNINMLPGKVDGVSTDTGGRFWNIIQSIQSEMGKQHIHYVEDTPISAIESTSENESYYDLIDKNWIHLRNGANWLNSARANEKWELLKQKYMNKE